MLTRKKTFVSILILAIFLLLSPAIGETQVVKLRVGYLPATHDLLFFIAMERGFFKEEGLEVEAFQFAASGPALSALKAKQLDVAIPGVAAPIFFISQGNPFTMVGGAAWYSAGVVVKKERAGEFKSLKDFKGKTVATVRLATGDATWRWGLNQVGMDWKKDVNIQEFKSPGDAVSALEAGRVDAAVLWSPHMSLAEKREMKLIMWTKDIYPHPCCRQVFHDDYIKEHPDGVVKYLKALIRANIFYKDPKNGKEILALGKKYLGELGDDVLKKEWLEIEPALKDTRTAVSPAIGSEEVKKYAQMMSDIGYIDQAGADRAKARVDNSFLIKAYLELGLAKTKEEAKKLAETH
jgi:NitT/TauT family transport system substrate-binding protein